MANRWIGCLWLPHFALRVETIRQPALDGAPIALSAGSSSRGVVMECSPEAESAGVRPEMPLREALSICRGLVVVTPDAVRYTEAFERILDALEEQCGPVEPAGLGLVFFDAPVGTSHLETTAGERAVEGLSECSPRPPLPPSVPPHAGGGEEHADLVAILRTPPAHFRARLGVARNKFAAEMAARQTGPGQVAIVPSGGEAAFLAPLPAHWLSMSVGGAELARRFEQQAIRTLGDLAALPLGPVQAQFGTNGGLAWRLARGQDPRPLQPRAKQPRAEGQLAFPTPMASMPGLLAGLERLLVRVFSQPALRGRTVEQIRLRAWLADGGSWERTFTLREPVASARAALAHLRGRLSSAHPEGAVTELAITLALANAPSVVQEELWSGRRHQLRGVAEAARQLRARFGQAPGGQLYRIVEVEPWSQLPERRWALVDYAF